MIMDASHTARSNTYHPPRSIPHEASVLVVFLTIPANRVWGPNAQSEFQCPIGEKAKEMLKERPSVAYPDYSYASFAQSILK